MFVASRQSEDTRVVDSTISQLLEISERAIDKKYVGKTLAKPIVFVNLLTPYPINKSATIEVIQNRVIKHELGEGKSNNR